MWRRILTWIGWIVGSLLGLVVIAYLGLLAINWRDQPPSDAARRLAAIAKNRPPLADAENGWVYLAKFREGLQDRSATRSPAIRKISESCRGRVLAPDCVVAFDGEDLMREWTQSEQDLLDRYLAL